VFLFSMKLKSPNPSLPCGTHDEFKASFANNEKKNQHDKNIEKKNSLVERL